jgi:hypothetical protein
MGVTGVSQPRRTSRTLTLPSPAASHRLAAPAQGEEPANKATATATEASAARAHRNAGLRAERREGDDLTNTTFAGSMELRGCIAWADPPTSFSVSHAL